MYVFVYLCFFGCCTLKYYILRRSLRWMSLKRPKYLMQQENTTNNGRLSSFINLKDCGKRSLKNLNYINNLLVVHSFHRTSFDKFHLSLSTMLLDWQPGFDNEIAVPNRTIKFDHFGSKAEDYFSFLLNWAWPPICIKQRIWFWQ